MVEGDIFLPRRATYINIVPNYDERFNKPLSDKEYNLLQREYEQYLRQEQVVEDKIEGIVEGIKERKKKEQRLLYESYDVFSIRFQVEIYYLEAGKWRYVDTFTKTSPFMRSKEDAYNWMIDFIDKKNMEGERRDTQTKYVLLPDSLEFEVDYVLK